MPSDPLSIARDDEFLSGLTSRMQREKPWFASRRLIVLLIWSM
jgi:hypothetical protein